MYDGGVHADTLASLTSKGTQNETERAANHKGKKRSNQAPKRMKGKARFSKNRYTGGGRTAVSAATAPPRGMEQAIQRKKIKNTR